ncbi:TPA: hypothetical protein ACGD7M_001670 [Serratia marcescens]
MSTEKLSELSKPVVWEISNPGEGTYFIEHEPQAGDYRRDLIISQLYSQEYVSALLAELEAKDKCIAEAEVRGVEKLAAAFKSWASDETFPDYEAQRHWATASQEALSFAGDLRNGSCDDR